MHDGTDAVQFSGARVTVGYTADDRGWCDVRARFTGRLSTLTTRVFAACLPAAANADVTAVYLHAQRTRAKVATMEVGVFATSLRTELTSHGHFANGQAVRVLARVRMGVSEFRSICLNVLFWCSLLRLRAVQRDAISL
jgi:hypothetical protein